MKATPSRRGPWRVRGLLSHAAEPRPMTKRRPPHASLLLAALLVAGCGASASSGGGAGVSPAPLPAAGDDRLVEEGDIVRLDGTNLFVLNAWKGLVVVSLADAAHPRISARLPLGGAARPVEMFARDGWLFALVDNSLDYLPCDSCTAGVFPIQNSELVVVDVSAPAAPRIDVRVGVPGTALEARLAGDVLYTVSSAGAVAVTSIDVSDPPRARPIDRADVSGAGQALHLHMRDGTLYVVASDPGGDPIGECGDHHQTDGCTFVSAVDVSAPDGRISVGASYAMAGHMLDRDSIDLSDGVLRVIVREGSQVATHPAKLRTFRARSAGELEPLASLLLGDSISQKLTAVRFDGTRAFAVTSNLSDPLYTLDLTDPEHPRVAGHVTSAGSLDHIELRGDRLIALGRQVDGADASDGGAAAGAAGGQQLQVALYDVGDLTAPRLLDRVSFGAGNSQTVAAQRDDLGNVFRVVDDRGLILVPYANQFLDDNWSYGRAQPHVQLVSFTSDSLALAGDLSHPGVVLRALPFGAASLVTISDQAVQVADVSQPAAPVVSGAVELARRVADAAFSDGKAVALSVDPASGDAVLSAGASDGFDVSAGGLPTLGASTTRARLFLDGTLARLVSVRGISPNTMVEMFDVGDPARIVRRGSVLFDVTTFINTSAGFDGIEPHGPGSTVDVAGPSLVAMVELAYPTTDVSFTGLGGLILVDTSDPDHPGMAGRLALPTVSQVGIVSAAAGRVDVVTEEWAPGADKKSNYYQSAFFLSVVDVTDPRNPHVANKVVLPGSPLAFSDRFVCAADGAGTHVETFTSTGELAPVATFTGGSNQSIALEGTRAVFVVGTRLDVVGLVPLAVASSVYLPGTGTFSVAALAGGHAFMQSGEVIDVRGAAPLQVAFLPPDDRNTLRAVRVETSAATGGGPVRGYYVGGFRGIQAVPF